MVCSGPGLAYPRWGKNDNSVADFMHISKKSEMVIFAASLAVPKLSKLERKLEDIYSIYP